MTPPDRFLEERIGLRMDGAARARTDRVVRDVARRAGCPVERFGRVLDEDPLRAQELIDSVTVQETGFFRHPQQFEALPAYLRRVDGGVIWSAGCANGQEAWSLAMLLEEHGLANWTVLASDVSQRALARARAGVYSERELRGLSPIRRLRFITGDTVNPRLRDRVRFIHHNIALTGPPAEAYDCRVVFCRNVLIYLHRPAIEDFLAALRRRMPQGALFMLGMGETLGPVQGFRPGPVTGALVHDLTAVEPFTAGVSAAATPGIGDVGWRR